MNSQFDYEKPFENLPPQPRYVTYVPYGMTPKEYEERKEIKKTANTIGVSFLIVLAISLGSLYILKAIFAILSNFGIVVTSEFIMDPAFSKLFNAIFSIFMFTIPFVIVFKLKGYRISGLIRFKKPKKEDILPYTLIGISFCAFSNMICNFFGSFFSFFGVEYEVDFGKNPAGFFGFMLTTIATAVVPALVEEFACRGIMMGSLRKFGDEFAIVCSAVIFGAMHGNFKQIPFAILTGLCLGFIAVKTKTIWVAVIVHFLNNFISVVLDYLFTDSGILVQNVAYSLYSVIVLILGLVGFFLLKDRKNIFKFKSPKTELTTKKLYKLFFTSATVVIFLIICFIESLAYFKF